MRAARALLGISQTELASRVGVSVPTIKRCESERSSVAGVSAETKDKVRTVLESEGIEFTNGNKPGVRLAHPKIQTHIESRRTESDNL
nr:helix-turn-helix transcriptional regulator [Stappia sp. P2PMeth1]